MLFPWLGEFEKIALSDVFVHGDSVKYKKDYYSNRTTVKAPSGLKWITVPVQKVDSSQKIIDVKIDNTQSWKEHHYNRLKTYYAMAPFKMEMLNLVEDVYSAEHENISELAIASIHAVCLYLNVFPKVGFSRGSRLNITHTKTEGILEILRKLRGSVYLCGMGSQKVSERYLNHELLESERIRVEYIVYRKTAYRQLYGLFNTNVSILDGIANCGRGITSSFLSNCYYWKDLLKRQ